MNKQQLAELKQECDQYLMEINQLASRRQELREREKNIAVTSQALANQYELQGGSVNGVRDSLASILPRHLQPSNVGDIDQVAWLFYYPLDFDFGTNPVLTRESFQEVQTQVSQEAAFLLMGLSVNFWDYSESGFLGPYTFSLQDAQSTRQFNLNPVPLTNVGMNSCPSLLPTPLLFQPNATMRIRVGTLLGVGETMNTTGSGRFQIMLHGLRIRLGNNANILSTVFAK